MQKNSNVLENYQYTIPHADLRGIAKASTTAQKRSILLLALIGAVIFATCVLNYIYTFMLCCFSILGFMIFSLILQMRNITRATLELARYPEDRIFHLRFYDDFLSNEVTHGEGTARLTTSALSNISIIGENDKYLIITDRIYAIPVPKSILTPTSFLFTLYSFKGKNPKITPTQRFFAEPMKNRSFAESENIEELNTDNGVPEYKSETTKNADIAETSDVYAPQAEGYITNEEPRTVFESESTTEINSDVKENSEYNSTESDGYYNLQKTVADYNNTKTSKIKKAGKVTFIAAFISIILAFFANVIAFTLEISNTVPLLILALLPISSIVAGIILYKNKEDGLKNILIGILALIVISSYINFIPMEIDEENTAYAIEFSEKLESELKIDLPELNEAYYYESEYDATKNISATLKLEETDAFIEYAKQNPDKFIFNLPSTYAGLLPIYDRDGVFEVALIYNATEKTFNTIPTSEGAYEMVYIYLYTYDDGCAYLKAIRYTINYTTEFKAN